MLSMHAYSWTAHGTILKCTILQWSRCYLDIITLLSLMCSHMPLPPFKNHCRNGCDWSYQAQHTLILIIILLLVLLRGYFSASQLVCSLIVFGGPRFSSYFSVLASTPLLYCRQPAWVTFVVFFQARVIIV